MLSLTLTDISFNLFSLSSPIQFLGFSSPAFLLSPSLSRLSSSSSSSSLSSISGAKEFLILDLFFLLLKLCFLTGDLIFLYASILFCHLIIRFLILFFILIKLYDNNTIYLGESFLSQ